jgi:hypothetical protein
LDIDAWHQPYTKGIILNKLIILAKQQACTQEVEITQEINNNYQVLLYAKTSRKPLLSKGNFGAVVEIEKRPSGDECIISSFRLPPRNGAQAGRNG